MTEEFVHGAIWTLRQLGVKCDVYKCFNRSGERDYESELLQIKRQCRSILYGTASYPEGKVSEDGGLPIPSELANALIAELNKQWTSEEVNNQNFGKEVDNETKQEEKPIRFREFF